MKSPLTRLLLACAALAALSPPAAAQPRAPRARFPAPSTAHNGVITKDVQGESDPVRTVIALQPMYFEQTETQHSSFSLAYAYTTNPFKDDGGVRLIFQRRGPQCLFRPDSPVLITLGNGVPVRYDFRPESGLGVNYVYSEVDESGACVESLSATLLPKTFAQLAAGRPRRASIGTAHFAFDLNQTNAMRAFNDMVTRAPN